MIADTDEKINECIEKSLNYLSAIGRPIVLKCEQRTSIQHLLLGKDVIVILYGAPEVLQYTQVNVSQEKKHKVFYEENRTFFFRKNANFFL